MANQLSTHTNTALVILRARLTVDLGDDDLRPLTVARLLLNPTDGFPESTRTNLVSFLHIET